MGSSAQGPPSAEELLGPLEARVLRDVWEHGESTVADVLERLNAGRGRDLAYNTVMSVMARLADKQILVRERDGRAYRYQAAVDAEGLAHLQARRAAGGVLADFGDAAVAGFVDAARDRPELLRRLREALEEEAGG